jgi:FAD binding domain/Berberine and berberine like
MDRRSFLRGAAAVGSTVVAGGVAAGCSGGQPERSGAHGTSTSTSAKSDHGGPPNWHELAASLAGTLLLPGQSGYLAAGQLYNALYAPNPAAIAQCESSSDVQRCLAFARANDVEVAVRSGGHSYGGYSSGPGLVIDVSRLQGVSMEATIAGSAAGQGIVTVGAGTELIDVYSDLAAQGLLLPGGSCPTVGIAGLALGGGIGVFARSYGLTCDQMAMVDIVTADGVLHRCGPGQDEDLYWACRGGGGGNFGVVTSFDFRVSPIPAAITLFTLEWPWGAAATVLDAWIRWIPAAPPELWANCQLYSSGVAGSGSVKVTGVFAGTVAGCSAALGPLTAAVGQATTYQFVGPEEYMTATMIEAGCEGKPVAQCATPVQSPFAAKSSYVGGPIPEQSVSALVSALSTLPTTVPGAGGGIVFDGYGGVINQVSAGETAFVHRDAVACAQYSITYPTTSPAPSATSAGSAWLDGVQSAFAPVSQGSYQNYIDPTLADWQQAYYGANLPRLRQVKRKYDPDDVFHFAQSIPPA